MYNPYAPGMMTATGLSPNNALAQVPTVTPPVMQQSAAPMGAQPGMGDRGNMNPFKTARMDWRGQRPEFADYMAGGQFSPQDWRTAMTDWRSARPMRRTWTPPMTTAPAA